LYGGLHEGLSSAEITGKSVKTRNWPTIQQAWGREFEQPIASGLSFQACCSSTANCADLVCNPPPSIHQRWLAFALPTNANLVG
jgi:hypothetical protein